jgi:hypothetical protein
MLMKPVETIQLRQRSPLDLYLCFSLKNWHFFIIQGIAILKLNPRLIVATRTMYG